MRSFWLRILFFFSLFAYDGAVNSLGCFLEMWIVTGNWAVLILAAFTLTCWLDDQELGGVPLRPFVSFRM